jgi:hypothetical protein
MPDENGNFLSNDAIAEFQGIYKDEFNEVLPFEDARKRAEGVLGFFGLLMERKPQAPLLTEEESKCVAYIAEALAAGRQPTVRRIAAALGRRSPRTGHKMLMALLERGVLTRNERGEIAITVSTAS